MTKCTFVLTLVMLGTTSVHRAQALQVQPPPTVAQSPAASPESPQASLPPEVAYGTAGGHALLLDIYQPEEPASGLLPAVVLIHGGSWTSLDKSTMRTMGRFLARSGFVAFAVDYRLLHGSENRWPAQLDDVQRAVRWIRANAAKYRVDPDHIGAFGHSAGAQLAALLGLEDTRDNSDPALASYSSRVQAVVDVSGPTDFTQHHDPDYDAFLSNFFGGDYAQHSKVWQEASPAFHVDRNDPPFLIVHGTQDAEVPMAQSQELADKLKQAGVAVKFVTVDDVHTFRTPEARKRMALETLIFFMQYLRPGNSK
ncbi:MAG TPA: alpha/beta hydrolase [Candidatus Sulfotelmatobacter sp.]